MAWRVLPQESVKAVQGYRMGNPGQVLMSDGQWALDVFLPHRPHATN